eukprot:8250907-Pyramimonas_sp.AAC.1
MHPRNLRRMAEGPGRPPREDLVDPGGMPTRRGPVGGSRCDRLGGATEALSPSSLLGVRSASDGVLRELEVLVPRVVTEVELA